MVNLQPPSPQGHADALGAVLRSRGFETRDFQLDEQPSSKLAQLLGVAGGVLRVKCCSTGEERLYSIGSGSAWLGAFLMDLGGGHFARAARRANALPRPQWGLMPGPLHA